MRRIITPAIWLAAVEQVQQQPQPKRSALRRILDAIAAGRARLDIDLPDRN